MSRTHETIDFIPSPGDFEVIQTSTDRYFRNKVTKNSFRFPGQYLNKITWSPINSTCVTAPCPTGDIELEFSEVDNLDQTGELWDKGIVIIKQSSAPTTLLSKNIGQSDVPIWAILLIVGIFLLLIGTGIFIWKSEKKASKIKNDIREINSRRII